MTVSYAAEVAKCTGLGCFPKLLLRWRASIYKLIWLDLVIYLVIFYSLHITYRFILNDSQKVKFEMIVEYCYSRISLIPIMFVLGFYVSVVVKRWWEQYMTLPWPDSTAVYVSSLIRGQDENGRKMRRTIMRYVCLSLTMVAQRISPRVKKRFRTLDHLVEAGLLVESEKKILKQMSEKFANYSMNWMPIVWASSIVTRARREGRIRDDSSIKTLIDSLNTFRGNCMSLTFYDTISIPLVYTQVVTIAVYSYFLASVLGRQWTERADDDGKIDYPDLFPVFAVLELLFFMGWFKVAESLICPFGEDDDDFELNWMIDRNLQVSYLIVDEMHNDHPDLLKDQFWNEILPKNILYIKRHDPPTHSTARMDEPQTKKPFFAIPIMDSITHLFFRNAPKTTSTDENLDKINSTLKRMLDSQSVRASHDPEEPVGTFVTGEVPPIKDDSQDEFELLRQQRLQERAIRQNFLLAVPTTTGNSKDEQLWSKQESSQESLLSVSKRGSNVSKEMKKEEKKDV